MDEKQKQLIDQCKVVAHMATALAEVYSQKAKMYQMNAPDEALVNLVVNWSAAHMEILGDILNGMDAVDETEDAWTIPIFKKAQELWPQAATA